MVIAEEGDINPRIDDMLDFAKGTIFMTGPEKFQTALKGAEAVMAKSKKIMEIFNADGNKEITELGNMVAKATVTKTENTVICLFSTYKDNALKLKRLLRDMIATTSDSGVWPQVHGVLREVTEEFLGPTAKAAQTGP